MEVGRRVVEGGRAREKKKKKKRGGTQDRVLGGHAPPPPPSFSPLGPPPPSLPSPLTCPAVLASPIAMVITPHSRAPKAMTYVRSRRSPRMPDSGVARAWTRPRTKVMSPRVEGAAFQAAPTKEKEAGRMASSAFSTTYARLATPVVRRRAARARGVSAAWTASWVASNAGAARGVAMDSGFLRAVAVAVAACERGGGRGRRGGGEGGGIRAGRVRVCCVAGRARREGRVCVGRGGGGATRGPAEFGAGAVALPRAWSAPPRFRHRDPPPWLGT